MERAPTDWIAGFIAPFRATADHGLRWGHRHFAPCAGVDAAGCPMEESCLAPTLCGLRAYY